MAHSPLETSSDDAPRLVYERFAAFRALRRLNRAIHEVERTFVITALMVMSAVVFLDVYFRFLVAQRGTWRRIVTDDAVFLDLWPIAAVTIIVAALFASAWRSHPLVGRIPGLQRALTALGVVATLLLSMGMLWLPSSAICAGLALLTWAWLLAREANRPRPVGSPALDAGRAGRLAAISAGGLLGLYVALHAPEGYSWALRFALFLMLWMAFLGASMATFANRHLRVDAIRKAIPEKHLHAFNALSTLVAGLVTAAFTWLAILYFQRRLGQATTPGEIPEWVKTLAIPFSLMLITARFHGQAIVHALEALLLSRERRTTPREEVAS
ncbi:MAG: TRAP transporter small permease [Deltaproteobacteria bacterium]|nr:MAG: TRAP transporter small permease [Deltaproteobacteria bacterium]